MSPTASTATLGANRWLLSGFHVPSWTGPLVWTVPPVTLSWYQRMLAIPLPFPTVWLIQMDSVPPMFLYCACIMSRYDSVSIELPLSWGTWVGPTANEVTGTSDGPLSVELARVVQSGCSFQTLAA